VGTVTTHDPNEPRWLRLAATRRAEPAPATLARVRARLAARSTSEPAWVRWFARPASLAFAAGLLVVSAVLGVSWLRTSATTAAAEQAALASVWSSDDLALGLDTMGAEAGAAAADSQEGGR
jgi:hypothetical protein